MSKQNAFKVINFVHNDEIWKSHVSSEKQAAQKWPGEWGFITEHCENIEKQFIKSREKGPKNDEKLQLPKELRQSPCTPIEAYIKSGKSPKYPATTSGKIGWRSSQKEYNLEIYGRYCRANGSLYKQLGWPAEAV